MAFYGLPNLTEVVLHESALENVTFAEGVEIGDWAFSRTSVTLP